jgi:hypothetical protein
VLHLLYKQKACKSLLVKLVLITWGGKDDILKSVPPGGESKWIKGPGIPLGKLDQWTPEETRIMQRRTHPFLRRQRFLKARDAPDPPFASDIDK